MRKNKIKVSVIVPVYNVEEYIDNCLKSLVNQTLKEIEIIVVNDGSPDNSQSIIDKYLNEYPKLIKSFLKENGGLSSARNFGIEKAVGEYIAFVDSDDYVELDMFEKMYLKARENDSDIVVSNYVYQYYDRAKKQYFNHVDVFGKSVLESPEILIVSGSFACNKIYKKSMWENNDFRFPIGLHFEDSHIIYNVMACANRVDCVNAPMYHYVKFRETSITNSVNKKMFDVFHSCDSIINFYKEKNYYAKLESVVEKLCIKHIYGRISTLQKVRYNSLSRDYINKAFSYLDSNFPNWRKNRHFMEGKRLKNIIKTHKFLLKFWMIFAATFKKILTAAKKILKNFKNVLIKRNIVGLTEDECAMRRDVIQKEGFRVINTVGTILNEVGVLHFADFGTLLGFIREKDFIKHDIDIDIGVIDDNNKKTQIIRKMEEEGYVLWREYKYNDNIAEHSFKSGNIKVDFHYYHTKNNRMITWLFYKKPGVKYENDNERSTVEMNYTKVDSTETIILNGVEITIPKNAEALLKEKYGDTWQVPNKDWVYWKSPASKDVEGLGVHKTYSYVYFAFDDNI